MKKSLIIGLLIFMVFGLSACGKKAEEPVGAETPDNTGQMMAEKSMMKWLKGGKTVKCEVKTPDGEVSVITKEGAVRMEGIPFYSMDSAGEAPEPKNGVMLTVGDWTYMWDKVSRKGTMMNMKEIEEMSADMPEENGQEEWDDMALRWEDSGYEYDCQETSADGSLFEKPEDVDFQDLNKMFEGYQEIGNELEAMMESGDLDMAEIEAMMQE
jgi:hypothetical protein